MDDEGRLRVYLGEEIPEGGAESDTLFTNDEIHDLLDHFRHGQDPQKALYWAASEGWERKASKLSSLVDAQTGGTSRTMSRLHDNAVKEADRYRGLAQGRKSTRIAPIRRAGTTYR